MTDGDTGTGWLSGSQRIIVDPDATPEEKFRAYIAACPPRPRPPRPTGWRRVRERVIVCTLSVISLTIILTPVVWFVRILLR